MPNLNEIIDINISLSTKGITQAGFGIPLIVGESMKLSTRAKQYANISEVSDDFAESDVEYKMANLAFSQEKTPEKIIIGKKVLKTAAVITSATRVGSSGVSAKRATVIQTGSNAEVGATATATGFSTTTYNGTATVIERISNDSYVVEYASALSDATSAGSGTIALSETFSQALESINDFDSDWYCAVINSVVESDILSAASKIESLKKLLIVRSNETDNFDETATGSILYQLKALSYDRTAFIYNSDISTKFIDSAWAGRMLPTIPGSENWAFKVLKGVSADNLKSAQSSAILNQNGNTFETIAGQSITRFGKVVSGEWIDVIRGVDWLKARLQENLFLLLINVEKVEFTDIGGDLIESRMREIFDQGVSNGLIAKDAENKGIYSIVIPKVDSMASIDKISRIFKGITFKATLAGAVNKIGISGNISA